MKKWTIVLILTLILTTGCAKDDNKTDKTSNEVSSNITSNEQSNIISNEQSNIISNEQSNIISNEQSNITSNKQSNVVVTNKLTNEEAMKIGQEKWNYAAGALFCDKFKYDYNDQKEGFVAVKNFDEVNSYFAKQNEVNGTGKSFKEYATEGWKLENGKYYDGSQCGRGGNIYYINNKLKLVSNEENEIKFTATATYCDEKSLKDNGKCGGKTYTKDSSFIIKKESNKWKIAKYTLPY